MDPETFWRSTPAYMMRLARGRRHQLEIEHNGRMTQAWLTAAYVKAAKMPKLDKILIKHAHERRPQTPEQMLAILQSFTPSRPI